LHCERDREDGMKVGFIGTGNMGGHMAMNLLAGGHQLFVYDLRATSMTRLIEAGATPLSAPAAALEAGEVVFTSLPTMSAVEAVYLRPDGLVANANPGQTLVDLSTILPGLAQRVHAAAAERGVSTLDSPVSGGTEAARDGALTIMVGGEEGAFRRVEKLLKLIGEHVFYTGASGSGSLVKLINQLLMGVNNAALLEGLAMAERSGVGMDRLMEILAVSSGASVALAKRAPRILEGNFLAGASVDIVEKDMQLVLALAQELGSQVPMAKQAREVYLQGKETGMGEQDIAAIVDLYRDR
jgi:3-hydroxyisobutyrate dehydrogenase-like beta-hydroxyacid dehydrogenase